MLSPFPPGWKYVTVTKIKRGNRIAGNHLCKQSSSVTVKYFVCAADALIMRYVKGPIQETGMKATSVKTTLWAMFVAAGAFLPREALADDVRLSGFPSLILSGGAAKSTSYEIPTPFDNLVKADTLNIAFGTTTLDAIQKQFGGEIRTRGAGADSVGWLCYQVALDGHASNLWFISNGEDSASKRLLTMVSAEESETARSGCSQGPETLTDWVLPVPGLKDDEADLQKAFGMSIHDGIIRYANENGSTLQALVYRLDDGKIDGMAFSQVTAK